MKPVEIEFLMRDKLSDGMEKAGQNAASMGDKVAASSEQIKAQIKETRENIKHTENDLKSLEKQLSKAAPGGQWMELSAEITACKKVLEEERTALAHLESQHDSTAGSAKRLSLQLREMYEQMATMRLNGQKDTQQYKELEAAAANLADTIGDVRAQTNILAHDNSGLQGLISGASGVAGAFTMATGVMGVFASENEDLMRIQTKVQSVMAITMGLQQVMNTLNQDSAFRLVTVTKAKTLFAAANTRLAVALGISNVAAKALMATLTLGLSVAIGAVIYLWDQFSSKQAAARKDFEDFTKKVSDGSASSITSFKRMVAEWEALADSLEEKQKYIDDNREAFDKLGVKINDVADAENLLVTNKDAFIESVMLKAKAAAAMEMASEKYKVAIEKMMEADKLPDKVTRYATYGMYGSGYSYEVDNSKKAKKQRQADEAEAEANAYILKGLGFGQEATDKLAEAGIGTTEDVIEGSVAAIEAVITQRRKALKDITNPADYQQALKEIELQEKKLKEITGDKSDKPKEEKVKNNLADLELRARQKIEDQTVALMEEGYEKQRRMAALAFEREKERITQEETERLALYEKLKAAGENVDDEDKQKIIAQAVALRVQAGALYDQAVAEVNSKEQKDEDERLQKLLEPYKDFAQRRLDIEQKYRKDIAELQSSRTDDNADVIDRAIEQAKRNRAEEYDQLDQEISDSARRSSEILEAIFTDAGQQSKKQIEGVVGQAEQLLKVLSGESSGESLGFSPEQVAAMQKDSGLIQELIQAIIDKKNELYDRGGLVSKFVGSFKQIKDALSLEGGQQRMEAMNGGVENLISSGGQLVNTFGGFADDLANIAELSGNEGLGSVASAMQGITDVAGSMMNGAQAGMAIGGPWGAAIGAAVSGVTKVFSMAAEASARHKAALKELEDARLAYQRKYNLLLLEQKLLMEEASNIFGERSILKAANALEVYREAIASYKEELKGDMPEMDTFERWTNDYYGTYAKRVADYEKGIGALASAQIVTGHKKTGLFGWGKGKDLYSSILEVYPDLIDSTGRLDTAMAESILSTHKMDDETKNLIQSLIDLQDQADAAEEQLRDYLKETFGSLGDGIMDSITNAIVTGGNDAWETFGKSGAATLENLGKQLAYSLFFAKRFDQLQKELEGIYGSGKSEEEIANDAMALIGNFYNGIGSQMDAAQGFMEEWQKKAAEHGLNLWQDENGQTQSGRTGAFQTMSQDTGSKLEGLFTSVQMHVANIDDKLDNIGSGIYMTQEVLEAIRDYVSYLVDISEDIKGIKRDGLKMK
ncbi:hypothetical protein [Parabacteroides sp. PF5-9]|uniref:hypothetical protein n=1 Tax=Parabacteroides sp. PF5-9 TaxID=1742404 RepID=UPI002474912B|nr:hypothetical protein [Parabacteroides sp. PF5-9]MDH6357243.1 hypothetical protein [Parabacteroides sp. PF5-9]